MAAPLRLAVVPMLAPTAPRLTHVTKSFAEKVMASVRDYYQRQSSGRANWTYKVFDWYRMPIPQDEFENLGQGLGDRALPLLARDIGLDASQFTHFAFLLDHEKVGPLGAWFPQPGQRKYLHIGVPDLSPSLLEHELGHMFGLGHANLDLFPKAPAEYGDYFCVMGSVGAYGFEDKTISFKGDFGDPGWFLCTQCGAAFRQRIGDVSLCPGAPPATAGHRADPTVNYNPRHEPPAPSSDEESSWRFCGNCGAIFYHGADLGHCPAGSGHQPSTDGTPSLILRYGSPPIKAEMGNWQQCVKCRVLYKIDAAARICTVAAPTAEHEPVPSGHTYVLPFDNDNNLSGPGLCAPMLEAAGWLDPAAHGTDIGAQLVNRPGSTEVELTWLRGVPAPGPTQAPVYAFAEGLAAGRLYVEFRRAGGDDDVKLPQSSPGTSGWVLVHVQQPDKQAHLLARLSSVTGASAYVQYADLHVRVIAEPSFNRVRLGITSAMRTGWPAQHLTSKAVLQELSEVRPAIASGPSYVALAWTGTDNHLNAAISTDGGHTFAPKMHPVEKSGDPPALAGGDLYIAWTGIDKRLNVGELFGVFAMGGPVTLAETSDFGPALARDRDGKLFLAWTGEDNSLNMIWSTDDGWTWIDKKTFDLKSNDRPALASDPTEDRMFLAWRTEEDLHTADVKLIIIDEDIPEGSPGRYTFKLGEVRTTNELSEDAPSLAVHDHRFYLGWTGTDETLNLSGPMFTPALPAKRVLDPERSENDIDLTAREDTIIVGWTGTDETLNVGIMDMGSRGRQLDDFQTGVTHMVVLPTTTRVSFQTGSMIGGSRRVRVLNRNNTARAEVDLWAMFGGGLELQLGKNHGGATLELVYGPTGDAAGPALGLDLTQGGADRLRVNISQLGGAGLNIDAWLVTKGRLSSATAFVGVRGPVDFLFTDFDQGLLSNVDRLVFNFDVFDNTEEKPTLRIDSIEARGPADG